MPPSVQWSCVAGIGAEGQAVLLRGVAQVVEHDARAGRGRVAARRRSRGCRCRYFEKSITTATLQHWPARLVPPPRERTGASCARQSSIVVDDVVDRPRDDDADRHLAVVRAVGGVQRARARSKRTSPSTTPCSSRASFFASTLIRRRSARRLVASARGRSPAASRRAEALRPPARGVRRRTCARSARGHGTTPGGEASVLRTTRARTRPARSDPIEFLQLSPEGLLDHPDQLPGRPSPWPSPSSPPAPSGCAAAAAGSRDRR